MELIKIGPKLWVVQNDAGQSIVMTEDETEAGLLYFEIEGINRRHQPVALETQRKRIEGLKKANLVRQRRAVSQIIPIDNGRGG